MESATEVRYSGVVVGRSPQIRDRTEEGAFVVFSEPLPVGTSISIKIDEQGGRDQQARVVEVVESADAAVAGMRVRFGAAAEQAAPRPVRSVAVPAPTAAAAPPAAAAAPAAPVSDQPSSAVPVAVSAGSDGASGSSGSQAHAAESQGHAADGHPGDPNAHHHDGEGGRRKRRRR